MPEPVGWSDDAANTSPPPKLIDAYFTPGVDAQDATPPATRNMTPPRLTHSRLRVNVAARVIGVLALALLFGACTNRGTEPSLTAPGIHRGLTTADSVARGYVVADNRQGMLAPSVVSRDAVTDGTASIVSVVPGWFQGSAQPNTITVTLSGPVNAVSIVGRGAILCSGNYGDLVAYDAKGTEIGRSPLTLIDPSDCSPTDNPDNVTYGAHGSLTVAKGVTIARFDITPMSPREFEVLGNPGGRASQTYSATLGVSDDCELFKKDVKPADPLLNDPKVQKMLRDLADQTGWDKPVEQQAEVGAWIMKNPAGEIQLVPWPPVPGLVPNICLSTYDNRDLVAFKNQGYEVLAEVHTHPNITTNQLFDQNGVKCLGQDAKGNVIPRPYDFPPFGNPQKPGSWIFTTDGPSTYDTFPYQSNTTPQSYPSYVVEPGQIWRISNDGTGIPSPIPSYPVNKCVGNQK